MSKKSEIREFINEFADGLWQKMEESMNEELKEKISSVFGNLPAGRTSIKVSSSANGTGVKRQYTRLPCPVPGCKNLAAPRYHQVCPEHKGLPKKEIERHQAVAQVSGGLWYDLLQAKKERAREKAKAAKAA